MELRISKPVIRSTPGQTRLECTVKIGRKEYAIFIATPEEASQMVSVRGEAFVCAFLMVAMKLRARLVCDFTLDETFLQNISAAQGVLESWKVGFSRVPVVCTAVDTVPVSGSGVGSFFSGGVDSFYTLLKNKAGNSTPALTHLQLVQGFDIELFNVELFSETTHRVAEIAKQFSVDLVTVQTNIREVTDLYVLWNYAHGGALGAVAQFLSGGLSTVFVPSTDSYSQLFPWGSHPDLDRHWGMQTLQLIHDGNEANRTEKIAAYIAKSPAALSHLRVCYKNIKAEYNCGKCSKCLRTQIELRAAGVQHVSHLFTHVVTMDDVRGLNTREVADRIHLEAALDYLKQTKSTDTELMSALEQTLAKKYGFSLVWLVRGLVRKIDAAFFGAKLYKFLSRHGIL